MNLDNDKNKEILNLIYNVTSINIKNENFEKKFIQYTPNNMNKIFYFSNFENFKEKLTNYNLLETLKHERTKPNFYVSPSILKKIQSAGLL